MAGSQEDTTSIVKTDDTDTTFILVVSTDDGEKIELIVDSKPFSEGVFKHAYKARMISPRECDVVIKVPRDGRTMEKEHCEMDVQSAKIAEGLAKTFNEESGTSRPVHFRQPIPMKVNTSTRPKSQFKEDSYVLVEAYLEGDYKKWNNNYDYVNEEDKTSLQAFSHFTHKKTNGKLLVCDIQGVKDKDGYYLTDPAIHSDTQGQYGITDFGQPGIDAFMKKHKCEDFCSKLAKDASFNESEVTEDRVTSPTIEKGNDISNRNVENTMLLHDQPNRKKPQPQHSSRSEKTKFNPPPKHQAATDHPPIPARSSLEASSKAEQLKKEGNKAYKDGDLQLAIRLYTQSLQHDPGDHTVYSNRSMAYEKTRKYEKALKDAEMSTQLKPDWVKGFYRKGVALTHLKRYSDAVDAYTQGLQYERTNQGIKKALASVEEMLIKQRMVSGIFGGEHAPSRPPTKQEKQIEHHRSVMENLFSQSTVNSLLCTGNALNDIPASVRKVLANTGSSEEISSEAELPNTGTYIIHREEVRLPNGSIRIWSLLVHLQFIGKTDATSSSETTKTTRSEYRYSLHFEWKQL